MKCSSFTEWGQLREVVVGRAENYVTHHRDLSFDLFFADNVVTSRWAYPRSRSASEIPDERSTVNLRFLAELEEDIEGFVVELEELGISVLRPMKLADSERDIETPAWSAPATPALNVRDNSIVLGDVIVETPPMIRSRAHETQLLHSIFQHYFDAGSRWLTMPRPIMTDGSFDRSYVDDFTIGGPIEPIDDPTVSPYDMGFEMMFDGAQCIRLGEDVIVNIANQNHIMAVDWLERELGDRFTFHRVWRLSDSHIDSLLLPLRPGVFLVRDKGILERLPKAFQSWDCIVAPPPAPGNFPEYSRDDLVLTSEYIDLNVLSLSSDVVMVNSGSPDLLRLLEACGFTAVPVQHRHRRLFGGGLHCFTLDMVRDGGLESYR